MANWLFEPPMAPIVPPILPGDPDAGDPAYDLFKYYAPRGRGVNVYQLQDGTFVQDYPTVENSNTSVPWPDLHQMNKRDENGNLVKQPVAEAWGIPGAGGAPNVTDFTQANPIVRVFHGGHKHIVNDATATQLTAAGYTVTGPV